MWGVGEFSTHLAIYGSAPEDTESLVGEPFVGGPGASLDWGCFEAELMRRNTWVSNVLPCQVPSNNFQSFEAEEAQGACRGGFHAELDWLKSHGVTTILALGPDAARAFGVEGNIADYRGSVYQYEGFNVIPTYHPAHIHRLNYSRNRAGETQRVILKRVWVADIMKAKEIAQGRRKIYVRENFNIYPTAEDVAAFVDTALESDSIVGVDIEATALQTNRAQVVVIGLAIDSETAISVPFFSEGGVPYWHNGDRALVDESLDRLFHDGKLMFQYSHYDAMVLRHQGYNLPWSSIVDDTLILHHILSPDLPHRLGFIVSLYGYTPYWKEEFLHRVGNLFSLRDDEIRPYNLRDSVVLHQVRGPMYEEAEEEDLLTVYHEEAIPLIKPIGKMMENGMLLSKGKLAAVKKKLQAKADAAEAELRKLWGLPPGFNLTSDEDLRYLFYGITPNKFSKLELLAYYEEETLPEGKRLRKKGTKVYEDLLALKEVSECTPFTIPTSFQPRTTKSRTTVTVNEQGRLALQVALSKRLDSIRGFSNQARFEAERLAIEKELSFIAKFNDHAHLVKLISTYMKFPTWDDGRVHTTLLITGTGTGRLASQKPNLQNIPARSEDGKEIRRCFVAPPGRKIISGDYSNLEVWILAIVSNDRVLLEMLQNGINIHDANTETLFGLHEGDPKYGLARRAAKKFQFGNIQYGGADREIYEKVCLEVPELGLTFAHFVEAKTAWMAKHSDYAKWAQDEVAKVLRTHVSENLFGRKRTLFTNDSDIRKQALNTPIQGTASGVVNRALVKLDDRLEEQLPDVKLLLQIHDEIILEAADEDVPAACALMKTTMEEPITFPSRGTFRFLSDIHVADNWGDAK